ELAREAPPADPEDQDRDERWEHGEGERVDAPVADAAPPDLERQVRRGVAGPLAVLRATAAPTSTPSPVLHPAFRATTRPAGHRERERRPRRHPAARAGHRVDRPGRPSTGCWNGSRSGCARARCTGRPGFPRAHAVGGAGAGRRVTGKDGRPSATRTLRPPPAGPEPLPSARAGGRPSGQEPEEGSR